MSTPIVETPSTEAEKAPLKGTLLTPEQAGEWGNENVLIEKTPKTEANVLEKEESRNVKESEEEPKSEAEEVEQPEDVVYIEDPGDFTPQDYSFDVITYNEDGKKPKTVKIKSVEDWDNLLDTDPNLGSAANLMKAQRLVTKMENNGERDKAEWQKSKDEYDKALAEHNQSEAVTNTWANEIAYLEENGLLSKVPAKFKDVLWIGKDANKEALANEAVKAQIELLNYMKSENIKRRKLGLSDMGPEAAFNAQQRSDREKKQLETKKASDDARKEAGAKVAGTTPNPVTVAPKGIAVGVGGSLRDLGNTSWN